LKKALVSAPVIQPPD
jgi:hypothetical protein